MRDSIPRATALCLISCVLRVESLSSLVVLRLEGSQQLTGDMFQ